MERRDLLGLTGVAMVPVAGCVGDTEDAPDPGEGNGGDGSDDQTTQTTQSDDTEETTQSDDTEETTQSDDTEETTPEDTSGEAIVGQLVEGEQMAMVVESVSRTTKIGEFQEADDGNEFVISKLGVKNTTESKYATFSGFLQTQLKDSEGYTYSQTVAVTGNTFEGGELAPGEVSRGDVVYEVPTDASELVLQFDLSSFSFFQYNQVIIDLSKEAETIASLEQTLRVPVNSIGDRVSKDDVAVKVNSVETETSLSSFTEAEEGHEFVIVDITTTNNTNEDLSLSTLLQMRMKDGQGNSHPMSISALSELEKSYNESQPLTSGESRRGKIPYEVPEDASPLYWTFEFSVWVEGSKAFWQIR